MKTFFLSLSTFIISLFFLAPLPTSAQVQIHDLTVGIAQTAGYQTAGVTDTTVSQIIGRIIKIVLGMSGTVFLALTVYAGLLWMTASGAEEQVEQAKSIIQTSIMGLVVILAAFSLTAFVIGALAFTPVQQVGTNVSPGNPSLLDRAFGWATRW